MGHSQCPLGDETPGKVALMNAGSHRFIFLLGLILVAIFASPRSARHASAGRHRTIDSLSALLTERYAYKELGPNSKTTSTDRERGEV